MAALNDGTPALGRTSIGTMEDERNVFNEGNSAPFRMSTLAPDVYPAAPANIQFTRTSITGVADGDDDSDDLKDPEKGEDQLLTEDEVIAALPPWTSQITFRALAVGGILGAVFSFITMRFSLGPGGVVPTFNMPIGLISFVFLKPTCKWLTKKGWAKQPFTAQENTVAQTFAMAMTGSIWCLGFGSYLEGLTVIGYNLTGGDSTPGNVGIYDANSAKNIIGYGLCIIFIGIFVNLSVRKPLVIDYKLPYPTGTATGVMINSFFTNGELAKQQAFQLLKLGIGAFLWDFWVWFFDGNCATYIQALPNYTNTINAMPNLGYRAYNAGWYFDFTIAYIGAGFITPLAVNVSMMIGAVLSWGLAWPLLKNRAGDWYPVGLASHSFRGLFAYKVFFSIALYMGDGGYQVVRMLIISARHFRATRAALKSGNKYIDTSENSDALGLGIKLQETEEERSLRTRVFVQGAFHWSVSIIGYCVLFVIGCVAIPHVFSPVKWYYVAVGFLLVPFMGVANSYGAGLTDQDNSSMYGKLCIFIFAAWAGTANQGVIAGLGMCGVVLAATSQAASLMQDFRTGYYTLASPKALFSVQICGAFLGVCFSPAVFTFYNHAFKIGVDYLYSAPYAGIYRGMGIVAANGVDTLPHNCLLIACLMALGAVIMNLVRDFLLPGPYKKFMPIPSAISIPFYIGAPIAIDFCLGGGVLFFWRLFRPETAAKYGIVTGAGLMVGDGLWQLPFGILGIAKVTQPICMPFFQGVSTEASAYPLNATDIATQIDNLFANPNGMTGSLANASFSADDIATMTSALTTNIQAAIDGGTNYPWPS